MGAADDEERDSLLAELREVVEILNPQASDREAFASVADDEDRVGAIVDALYGRWKQVPCLDQFLKSDEQIIALRAKQQQHLQQIAAHALDKEFDSDDANERLRIGRAHFGAGLTPTRYLAAYGNYVGECVDEILRDGPKDSRMALRGLTASVFYDMAAALLAYRLVDRAALEEQSRRLEELNRELEAQAEKTRRLEKQLIASERLAALGTLTAGVAHDLSTPLTSSLLNVQSALTLVNDSSEPSPTLREHLADTGAALNHITKIVGDLKGVTGESSAHGECDPIAIVEHAVKCVSHKLRHGIELEVKLPKDLPPVEMEGDRLARVVLNLLLNADQAMPANRPKGNRVEVSASWHGSSVFLEVRDNGKGIPEAEQGRLFEAFFSTRLESGGTGLGLWICKDLVEAAGGHIEVASTLGVGTTMILEIPRVGSGEDPGTGTGRAPSTTGQGAGSHSLGQVTS